MSLTAKRESLARIHGRYPRAGRPYKQRILDEFCATCEYLQSRIEQTILGKRNHALGRQNYEPLDEYQAKVQSAAE